MYSARVEKARPTALSCTVRFETVPPLHSDAFCRSVVVNSTALPVKLWAVIFAISKA